MKAHAARSRITKALTDAGLEPSFEGAEDRLEQIQPCILLGPDAAGTAAGQAAALTALITARKCFGRVHFVTSEHGLPLLQPLLAGPTIGVAARSLGAELHHSIPATVTHLIRIGDAAPWTGWQVSAWWDRWLAGSRRSSESCGTSALPLSGVFAGALCVRQLFANVLRGMPPSDVSLSLWDPVHPAHRSERGPKLCTIPDKLWLVGLGHLGQGLVWALLFLPARDGRHIVLQDNQSVEPENEPTCLLVTQADVDKRLKKVRVASQWLEHSGWSTELIERRHHGDICRTEHDPPILITALDDVRPRRILAKAGFDYMIDAGIGRGAIDFEGIQVRAVRAGSATEGLWRDAPETNRRERLLGIEAYKDLGECGAIPIADASVSVPFVGAATSALILAQLARIGAMEAPARLLQLELGAPGMVIDGGFAGAPSAFLGGEPFLLD